MITTEEIVHILRNEDIPDEQKEILEILLQERAEESLKKYSEGKTLSVIIDTNIEQFIDYLDLSEKMRDTQSTNIDNLIDELISEKIHDMFGNTGRCDYQIL